MDITFEGRTRECNRCEDGKNYIYTEDCRTCGSTGKIKQGTRNRKCSECGGNGYKRLPEKIEDGLCHTCGGSRTVSLGEYDSVLKEDKEKIWGLFNFEKPFTGGFSSFNEGYLGMGIVCGVTDYGRYKKMTEEEFRGEVKESFMGGWLQYISIMRDKKFPLEILIRRGESGWHAYPIFERDAQYEKRDS